jgi:hypothetical protein
MRQHGGVLYCTERSQARQHGSTTARQQANTLSEIALHCEMSEVWALVMTLVVAVPCIALSAANGAQLGHTRGGAATDATGENDASEASADSDYFEELGDERFGEGWEMGEREADHAHGIARDSAPPGAQPDPRYLDALQRTIDVANDLLQRQQRRAQAAPDAHSNESLERARAHRDEAQSALDTYLEMFSAT